MRTCGRHCLGLAIVLLSPILAWGDGGTLRFSKKCDGYRITLFTAPTALRAGIVDFSVLVQSTDSESALLDLPVTVEVYPANEPRQRTKRLATNAAATNKLFRAVQLELPQPGQWHVEVSIEAPNRLVRVDTDLEVGPAPPSWIELAPWICWPAAVIALFAIHQWLARRRRHDSREQGEHHSHFWNFPTTTVASSC